MYNAVYRTALTTTALIYLAGTFTFPHFSDFSECLHCCSSSVISIWSISQKLVYSPYLGHLHNWLIPWLNKAAIFCYAVTARTIRNMWRNSCRDVVTSYGSSSIGCGYVIQSDIIKVDFFAPLQFYFWKLCAGKWPKNL